MTTNFNFNVNKAAFVDTARLLTREAYYLLLSIFNAANLNPEITTQTLTDAATIAWDMSKGLIATVTLAGNRTIGAPTNIPAGGRIALRVIQDGTGTRTLTWNAAFKWPAGVAPVLTVTAAAVDVITGVIFDGATFQCTSVLNEK